MPGSVGTKSQLSPIKLKLKGQLLADQVMSAIEELVVEQDLTIPDAFTIRILDTSDESSQSSQGFFGLTSAHPFAIGDTVEIFMGFEESEGQTDSVLKAEVTSIELELDLENALPVAVIRGFDKSHRMNRERKSKTYANVSDSDIASTVISGAGLTPSTDSTSTVYPMVYQDDLTDWEFLRARANRVGYDLYVRGDTVYFKKPAAAGSARTKKFGIDLVRLRARRSASSQVTSVVVQSWDPKTGQQISGTASSVSTQILYGTARNGGSTASSAFGSGGKYVVVDSSVQTAAECTTLAQAILDDIAGDYEQLEGVCVGDSVLKPGCTVQLEGVGTTFAGQYFVSACTHRVDRERGYITQFVVNGRRPSTLSGLLREAGGDRRSIRTSGPPHPSVTEGIVTNVKDDEARGRIKVKLPWLSNADEVWARIASPLAGGSRGMFWLPEVNDEVLVAFQHGNIDRPYVIGYLWNNSAKPPLDVNTYVDGAGKPKQRTIKTPGGHELTFKETAESGAPSVLIKTQGGHQIELSDDSAAASVTVKTTGGHQVKLDDSSSKSVLIKSSGGHQVKLDDTGQAVTISDSSGASVKLSMGQMVEVKGGMINIEATGVLTLKGSVVKIN